MRDSSKVRLSVSLSDIDHKALSQIAASKKVSIAWVVRDAISAYVQRESPLFGAEGIVAEDRPTYQGTRQ